MKQTVSVLSISSGHVIVDRRVEYVVQHISRDDSRGRVFFRLSDSEGNESTRKYMFGESVRVRVPRA